MSAECYVGTCAFHSIHNGGDGPFCDEPFCRNKLYGGCMGTQVMVDLETLGNGNSAVIIAVGAVKFDPDLKTVDPDTFYTLVDPQSCVDAGLQMDVSTVMWWLRQSDEAREALRPDDLNKPHLHGVLASLMDWYAGDLPTWGNGATFDNVILRNAYKAVGMEAPWSFWNDRCYRTIKNQNPNVKMARTGTHHNALDDAMSQANHLIQLLNQGA